MTAVTAIINCTPHAIVTGNGILDGRTFPPSGSVARVSSDFALVASICGIPTYRNEAGQITGLPDPVPGVFYLVSAMVLDANNRAPNRRTDLIAPSTGHPSTVRNEAGHIVSVGGFVV